MLTSAAAPAAAMATAAGASLAPPLGSVALAAPVTTIRNSQPPTPVQLPSGARAASLVRTPAHQATAPAARLQEGASGSALGAGKQQAAAEPLGPTVGRMLTKTSGPAARAAGARKTTPPRHCKGCRWVLLPVSPLPTGTAHTVSHCSLSWQPVHWSGGLLGRIPSSPQPARCSRWAPLLGPDFTIHDW